VDTLKKGLLGETMAHTAGTAGTLMAVLFLQLTEAGVFATELWSVVETGPTLSSLSPIFALIFERTKRTTAYNQLT
jgi:hypothetical protein